MILFFNVGSFLKECNICIVFHVDIIVQIYVQTRVCIISSINGKRLQCSFQILQDLKVPKGSGSRRGSFNPLDGDGAGGEDEPVVSIILLW